ncbi:hypothetical protein Sru01_35690 [Sphaerisporangium rufum]|uniref:Uncharacterized protein n=1 Tax=Sphaerisporangium rufum TaxID=1381558 RepID=A0A919R2Q4_9ACTN|nr:hypothetical protein [Sphaerisporangium rufum]GII78587.1 hypothetical protein Sru01_35690 [Sphaerisporangium rufum]
MTGAASTPRDPARAGHPAVRRLRAAVEAVMESERRRRRAEAMMHSWRLSRADLDLAARALGAPPISDEEWIAVQDGRGRR